MTSAASDFYLALIDPGVPRSPAPAHAYDMSHNFRLRCETLSGFAWPQGATTQRRRRLANAASGDSRWCAMMCIFGSLQR